MLYENEELRLKTININAEIERGQSDIKKLKRENEMLKKEIWCLRDEYDKLDKLLKDKKIDFSSSSTTYSGSTSDSESCSSCTEESEEVETSQNLQNVQKTNLKNLKDRFDHLSVVTEETSCENSDQTRHSMPGEPWGCGDVIPPDQGYPAYGNRAQTLPNQQSRPNYFAPIQTSKSFDDHHFNQVRQDVLYPGDFYETPSPNTPAFETAPSLFHSEVLQQLDKEEDTFLSKKIVRTDASSFYQNMVLVPKNPNPAPEASGLEKRATDLIVKIDNRSFNGQALTYSNTTPSTTFSNGGNLEELLRDIESISQRGLPNPEEPQGADQDPEGRPGDDKMHKSELNVVLMPKAMPLIGFDKYRNIQRSFESLDSKHLEAMSASQQNLCLLTPNSTEPATGQTENQETNPFFFGNLNDNYFQNRYDSENFREAGSPENEENIKLKTETKKEPAEGKSPKMSITKKVSIHFKGRKEREKLKKALKESSSSQDGKKSSLFDIRFGADKPKHLHQKTPSIESKKSTTETSNVEPKTPTSTDSNDKKTTTKKERKSVSVSPDRGKHVHGLHDGVGTKKHKKHRKEKGGAKNRRPGVDPRPRERSYSICTDRSVLDSRLGLGLGPFCDDYSDRERTNSASSYESTQTHSQRKMSGISGMPVNGKLPWCGCWGNGCL